jgi:hypothetical protein
MPVVINDFEVVDAPAGTPAPVAAPRSEPPPADEEDLRRQLAELAEHALRVWSH